MQGPKVPRFLFGGLVVKIDDMSDSDFFSEFVKYFGFKRALTLCGHAVVWAVNGRMDDLASYRDLLMSQGLCRSAAYEALLDFRRFREHVEAREISHLDSVAVFGTMSKLAGSVHGSG